MTAVASRPKAEDVVPDAPWPTMKLADITEPGAPALYGILQPGPDTPGGVPYVRPTEVTQNIIQLDKIRRTTPEIASKYKRSLLETDDIILSIVGTIGKVALVPPELAGGNITQSSVRIRPRRELLLPRFLAWFLRSPLATRQYDAARLGTAVLRLNVAHVRDLIVPIPSLAEQHRIVAEIEQQFTRLDAGVAALRRTQSNLKRYRASVLKDACEGRLVLRESELNEQHHTRSMVSQDSSAKTLSSDYETGEELLLRILTESREKTSHAKRYKEPVAPKTADLPAIPIGWTWATINQIAAPEANSLTDGPFGSNLKTDHYTDSGPRVLRLQNIGDGVFIDSEAHISQSHFERLRKHSIFANDVVIAAFGESPPRSCVVPEWLGPAIVKADCIRLKPHSSVLPRYIDAALNSEPVRKRTKGMVHGVGRPRLNLSEIKSIVIPLPPLAEQTRIVLEIERRFSLIQGIEQATSINLHRSTGLRRSILQKAFVKFSTLHFMGHEPAEITSTQNTSQKPKTPEKLKPISHMKRRSPATSGKTNTILNVFADNKKAMTPEELFALCGGDASSVEDVERFFDELKGLIKLNKVKELRIDKETISLEASP